MLPRCPRHPKYAAYKAPISNCKNCWLIWTLRLQALLLEARCKLVDLEVTVSIEPRS